MQTQRERERERGSIQVDFRMDAWVRVNSENDC